MSAQKPIPGRHIADQPELDNRDLRALAHPPLRFVNDHPAPRCSYGRPGHTDGVEDMHGAKTWALVMNAVCARILRDLEDRSGPDPIELVSKAKSTHLRDIMADRAGRGFASDRSGRRAAYEPSSNPIRRDMQDFARETLEFLERHRRAKDFDNLAMFVDPQMLGIVRQEMPASLREVITQEEALNLVALSPPELRARVRASIHPRVAQ